jgi:SAM-dependent methyltransferase
VITHPNFTRDYRGKARIAEAFRDLVADSLSAFSSPTLLDIGCGRGICGDTSLQASLAEQAGRYIGIEPDPSIPRAPFASEHHLCLLESAPVAPESIHVAMSAFVLEHVSNPVAFWSRLHSVLLPGGVFWGLTVDRRSYFAVASRLLESTRLKDLYLNAVVGKNGDRYENYPTCYLANSPRQIRRCASDFSRLDFLSLQQVGQCNTYFPSWLRPVGRLVDRAIIAAGLPGSILFVRAVK